MSSLIALALLLRVTAVSSSDGTQECRLDNDSFLRCVQECRINNGTAATQPDDSAARLEKLQSQLDALQSALESSQTQVAFSAHNSADPFDVEAHGTLLYNVADLNLGDGFNTNTSIFTCPTAGLYVFTISCMADGPQDEDAGIMVDERRIGHCYANSQTHPEQGATSVTARLSVGQEVRVELFRGTARQVRGGYYNSFAGVLVKTD